MLETAGFSIIKLVDKTETAQAEAERSRAADALAGSPILGKHAVVGPSSGRKCGCARWEGAFD